MKKQWIVMLAISGIVMFLSCKEKNATAEEKQKHPDHHEVKHYYGVYTENLSPTSRTDLPSGTLYTFTRYGNNEVKYFNNDINKKYFETDLKNAVYKIVTDKGDTLITPINDSLQNNKIVTRGKENNPKAALGRGSIGCIPKFEENNEGDILHEPSSNDHCIVPLYLAKHTPFPSDSILRILFLENFKMTLSDFGQLNEIYEGNKNIEAGLDSISNSALRRLNIFNGPGQSILTIEEKP